MKTVNYFNTLIFALFLLALHIILSGPAFGQPRELTDMAGRTVLVPEEPERIVALAPSITELVFALDKEENLKGAVQYSDYPSRAEKLPRVGSYARPDVERIVRLEPDLVLAIRDGNPRQTIDRLEGMDIPVFTLDSDNLEEIMQSISALGLALNAEGRAGELVRDMQERLDQVQEKVAPAESRPSVFFQADAGPIIGAGASTFIDEMIHLAGGTNALAHKERYPRLGWEDILRLDPDVAVIASMSGGKDAHELTAAWQRWPQLRAVQQERVHVVDADVFERPTLRLLDGLEILAGLIHPQLFPDYNAY